MSKYSDDFMEWLRIAGYSHCFFVAGGNAMHLIESASDKFECVPFIHEVGAAIAADSFNEICREDQRAFVIVTAGPGLTNVTTAVASAWVDRRELLIIGGQAKSIDLSRGKVRQMGFQEIGGVEILSSITKESVLIDKQIGEAELTQYVALSKAHPKGPVFLEVCLDVTIQETKVNLAQSKTSQPKSLSTEDFSHDSVKKVAEMLRHSSRPLFLIGGAVERNSSRKDIEILRQLGIPLATTFNGADRVGVDYEFYCGRPNWYGSRWANLIIQQTDLVIAVGARLGLMQTGYNWQEFVPKGKVVQVEIEENELNKGFPKLELGAQCDPNDFLHELCIELGGQSSGIVYGPQLLSERNRLERSITVESNSRSGYLNAKIAAELIFSEASDAGLINSISPRLFAFAGPGIALDEHFAVGNFLRDGLQGKEIVVNGNPSTMRSYMYPTDLVIWILAALTNPKNLNVNIGSEFPISMYDLAHLISESTSRKGVSVLGGDQVANNYVPSTSVFRETFKVSQLVALSDGIERWIQWHLDSGM